MPRSSPEDRAAQRPDAVAAGGITLTPADRSRIVETVAASLRALDKVASTTIFDTEPSNFDRLLAAERPRRRTEGDV